MNDPLGMFPPVVEEAEERALMGPVDLHHIWMWNGIDAEHASSLLNRIWSRLVRLKKQVGRGFVKQEELDQAREHFLPRFQWLVNFLLHAGQETFSDGAGI